MVAKKLKCTVQRIEWITPTLMHVRFETNKPFSFQPGQFLSLVIPSFPSKGVKRLYSIASSPDYSKSTGIYELCVRYMKGGVGSEFLSRCEPGDKFEVLAPYGDFQYRTPEANRDVCLIATGSGIAPMRSIVLSNAFQNSQPHKTTCLLGVRTESEMVYAEDFARPGVKVVYAVSDPGAGFPGFKGRVTDFLKGNSGIDWANTDFYLCGNLQMIADVDNYLRGMGVSPKAISKEAFTSSPQTHTKPATILPFPRKQEEKKDAPAAEPFLDLRRKA